MLFDGEYDLAFPDMKCADVDWAQALQVIKIEKHCVYEIIDKIFQLSLYPISVTGSRHQWIGGSRPHV
jgi:hypothetical protein